MNEDPATRHGAVPDPGSTDPGSAPRHAASPGQDDEDRTTQLPHEDSTQAIPLGDATRAIPPDGGEPEAWRIGNRYRVDQRIGTGGMADVLRARDELLQRDVAVKVFRTPQTMDTAAGVERQQAELHALARLNHPYLITLYDGSVTGQDGPAYLVMELIDGPSLADRLREGALPDAEAREVGAQVAEALDYVHAQGMVHRDVKPANILLGRDRSAEGESIRARLSDFGIVRLLGAEGMTSLDATLGTASYLAPEQARGSGVGPPADVYSLGLTLIETVTGLRSFDGPPLEAAIARLTSDPVVPPDLPHPWPGLLRGMTARDPEQRPTAGQVALQLRATAPTSAHALISDSERTTALPAAGTALGASALGATALGAAAPATTAFAAGPVGTMPGGVAPAAAHSRVGGYPPHQRAVPGGVAYGSDEGEPERRRASPWPWLIAGFLVTTLVVLGAIALLSKDSPSTAPATTNPSVTAPAESSSKPPTRSASSSRSASRASSSAPSTSAPTSAPRTTSAPPSSTSAAPSTTSNPPSSTAAPTSTAAASSTPASTSPAAQAPPATALTSSTSPPVP